MKVNGVQLGRPNGAYADDFLTRATHERLERVIESVRDARRCRSNKAAVESIKRAQRQLVEALQSARQQTLGALFDDEA